MRNRCSSLKTWRAGYFGGRIIAPSCLFLTPSCSFVIHANIASLASALLTHDAFFGVILETPANNHPKKPQAFHWPKQRSWLTWKWKGKIQVRSNEEILCQKPNRIDSCRSLDICAPSSEKKLISLSELHWHALGPCAFAEHHSLSRSSMCNILCSGNPS